MKFRASFERAMLGLLSPDGPRARLAILTYHRVLPETDPLLAGEPDVKAFRSQMCSLLELCSVLPLPEAAQQLRTGRLPPRAACITFDDGYHNNLACAVPVLQELGLPATFFVTQQAVQTGIMWNDLVIEGIRRLRGSLDFPALGLEGIRVESVETRAHLIASVLAKLKYQPVDERWRLACELFGYCTRETPPRLMLEEADVASVADAGFDIGGHTVSHPILRGLPPETARREIADCAEWVKELTGRWPVSFAYPNGRPGKDFDATHAAMVRECNFRLAVSTEWAVATSSSSQYLLPRFSVTETGRPDIARRLVKMYVRSYGKSPGSMQDFADEHGSRRS